MAFELIIFDCDGVLVDSEPISNRTLIAVLDELGLTMSYEESVAAFVGRSISSNLRFIEDRLGRPLPLDFGLQLQLRAMEAFKTSLQPIEGIAEVLPEIQKPMCVASGSNHDWIRLALDLTGLLPYFENKIFSASEVKHGKPAPDVFLHAAERMGFLPSRCAVVEDSIAGVQSGVNAGMVVFAYKSAFDSDELTKAGAHYVFDDMRKLPKLLTRYC